MAQYEVDYSCGHSGTVNLIGPHRSRESRLAYYASGKCSDCYKKHATEVAQKQAQEMELPALIGTVKQIEWAETLRAQKLQEIDGCVEHLKKHDPDYRQIILAVEKISNETSARQWIEWRNYGAKSILLSTMKAMESAPIEEELREQQEAQESVQRMVLREATIRPEYAVSETVAEITVHDTVISCVFAEKSEKFREIIKSLRFSWKYGNTWQRSIGWLAGLTEDRAAELGHTLLAHGFIVRAFDDTLRDKIACGTFETEQTRWIIKCIEGLYAGWFALQWGPNEDYYEVARKLRGSQYNKPHVVVPAAQFEHMLDFAERYSFKLSADAQKLAKAASEDKQNTLIVAKKPIIPPEKIVVDAKPPTLAVPEHVEVADELRDED